MGVSRTSIYNLIKKNNIQTFKKGGKTYIDESGESLIRGYYNIEQHKSIDDIISNAKSESGDEVIQTDFQENQIIEDDRLINFLGQELEEKNKTIQALINALTVDKQYQTAKLIADNQGNFHARAAYPNKQTSQKKNFFNRFFKK